MIRALLLAALLLLPAAARAQKCPGSYQSWSFTLQAPMQFAVFDLNNNPPGLPAGVLTVLFLDDRTSTAFVGVPETIASQFQVATNQYQFYQQRILPAYHQVVLAQGQPFNNCPIYGPDGYAIWLN